MSMGLSSIGSTLVANKDLFAAVSAAFAAGAAISKLGRPLKKLFDSWLNRRTLLRRVGADLYPPNEIIAATRHYIPQDCQNIDPAGNEDWRAVYALRSPLYRAIDEVFSDTTEFRHTILLADAGMGKTSFVLNYYARHLRTWRKRFRVAVIPLGSKEADARLATIADPAKTVVFLDALDEDTKAIGDYRARIAELMERAAKCRHVVVTCRTQFFLKDDEIPRETGILRVGVTRAGHAKEYLFRKLYLCPFSDEQVRKYLSRRFPFWRRRKRAAALEICNRISDLALRPMLLDRIPDLLSTNGAWDSATDLYREMVSAWAERERGFFAHPEMLIRFSERLAVNLYSRRAARGSESVSADELEPLAAEYGLPLLKWQLTGRSLLNRFGDGRYKFAHRSIMEYLFVRSFIGESETFARMPWTDQMKRFLMEIARDYYVRRIDLSTVHFENADLDGWHALGWVGGVERMPYQTMVNRYGLPPLVGRTYTIGVDENIVQPPIMLRTGMGTLIGVDAQRHILQMTVGHGMRDAISEAEPISNFTAQCRFDLFVNLMWAGPLLTNSKSHEEIIQTVDLANFVRLGGFKDWRLPTTAEAQTLLRRYPPYEEIITRGAWLKSPLEFVPKPMTVSADDNDELLLVFPGSIGVKRSGVVERGDLLVVRNMP